MATVVARAAGGLAWLFSTLWGFQEQRFTTVFDTLSSGLVCLATALILCFSAIRSPREA